MKNLKSIACLVGSLIVVGCSGGDSSAAPPSDPTETIAPLRAASAQAVTDAIALRDQLQAASNGDDSVVAPGHRLVKIAKIQQRAIEQLETLMELSIADHNGTSSGLAVQNTGSPGGSGAGGSGSGASGSDNGADAGVTTGDPDIDDMNDDMSDMDDDLDGMDDDLDPGGGDTGGMDAGASDPCKCTNGSGTGGSGSGGKPSSAGKGSGKSGGSGGGKSGGKAGGAGGGGKPSGGSDGAALQKLLDKLMKMLEKASSSPGAAKAKTPKAAAPAQTIQADLTQLYKLLNDPTFKKWQKFGGG